MKSFWFAFVLVCTASEVVWADNVNAPLETTGMSSTGLFGTIIDAKTKQPIQNAVIQVAWVEHAEGDKNKKGGQRTKRLWVRQVFSGAGGRFDFANRRQIPDAPGWKFLPGQDPIVRIYAKGHHRLVIDNTVKGKIGSPIPIKSLVRRTLRVRRGGGVVKGLKD